MPSPQPTLQDRTKRQGGYVVFLLKHGRVVWTLVMAVSGYWIGTNDDKPLDVENINIIYMCYGIWGSKEEYHGIRLLDIVGIIFDWLVAKNRY